MRMRFVLGTVLAGEKTLVLGVEKGRLVLT